MKYNIIFACGHPGMIELFGKGKDRAWKLKNSEYRLCPECYRKKKDAEAKQQAFVFHASVSSYIDRRTGELQYKVWFSGNSKPHKDEIKGLGGYYWNSTRWENLILESELEQALDGAESIGAVTYRQDKSLLSTELLETAKSAQAEWKKMQEEIRLIDKPEAPDILHGGKWNYKIYGRPENRRIFINGVETPVTKEQEDILKEYLEQLEKYRKKVSRVENRFIQVV